MSIKNIFKKSISEQSRMDYDIYMKRVKEYLHRRGIDINSGVNQNEMREAYDSGIYPSKFARRVFKRSR